MSPGFVRSLVLKHLAINNQMMEDSDDLQDREAIATFGPMPPLILKKNRFSFESAFVLDMACATSISILLT